MIKTTLGTWKSKANKEREKVKIMCEMKIALTNLGKYNEGYLIYKWLELPATDDEIKAAMDEIGINERYEEWFITDYECSYLQIGEYDSIDELNEIAEALDDLDDYEKDIVKVLLDEGYDLDEALEIKDDCIVWSDCDDMADVAYQMYEEGLLGDIPEHLVNYIDWEAYGRDLSFEAQFIESKSFNGYIEVIR